jgi:hypothetical protein
MSNLPKSRKTAFARKPRGETSTATAPKKTIINREFLMKMKEPRLDESLNDVLTATGGVLTLEFRAQSGSSTTIVDKRGETIADNNDVMRILTMNSFLTKEKSKVLKESAKGSVVRILWAIKEYAAGLEGISVPEEIPASMRDIISKMQTVLQILKANMDQVSDYQPPAGGSLETSIKNHLVLTNVRIRNGIVNYLVKKLTDKDNAGTINAALRERKVPIWVYSKLTSQKLNLSQKGYEFKSIYYPKDPSKGICLSFSEIRDNEFIRAQGGLLIRACFVAQKFMCDNEFVQSFCNIEDVTNEETMKTLANVPVLLPEPSIDAKNLVEQLADQGIRQYSWPVGYAISPKDNLQYLGTVFKRAAVVALVRPQYKSPLIEKLFPGFVYDPANRTANIFQQLKASPIEGLAFVGDVFYGGIARYNHVAENRLAVFDLLADILEISPSDNDRRTLIRKVLTIDRDGEFSAGLPNWAVEPALGFSTEADKWGTIATAANTVDVRNLGIIELDQSTRPQAGKKKEKKVSIIRETVANRTLLTAETKKVLILLASLKYKALIPTLESFFRAFLSTAVQAAVARLMYARIAAVLAKPAKLGKKDLADLLDLDAVSALGDTLGDDLDKEASDSSGDESGESDGDEEVPNEVVVA